MCCGDEDVTQSPLAPVQRVYDEDDTEMVIRSHGQQLALAPAGQQEQQVTHLAAHSIADGKQWSVWKISEEGTGAVAQSLSQFCLAGDVINWQYPYDGRPSDFHGRI